MPKSYGKSNCPPAPLSSVQSEKLQVLAKYRKQRAAEKLRAALVRPSAAPTKSK